MHGADVKFDSEEDDYLQQKQVTNMKTKNNIK